MKMKSFAVILTTLLMLTGCGKVAGTDSSVNVGDMQNNDIVTESSGEQGDGAEGTTVENTAASEETNLVKWLEEEYIKTEEFDASLRPQGFHYKGELIEYPLMVSDLTNLGYRLVESGEDTILTAFLEGSIWGERDLYLPEENENGRREKYKPYSETLGEGQITFWYETYMPGTLYVAEGKVTVLGMQVSDVYEQGLRLPPDAEVSLLPTDRKEITNTYWTVADVVDVLGMPSGYNLVTDESFEGTVCSMQFGYDYGDMLIYVNFNPAGYSTSNFESLTVQNVEYYNLELIEEAASTSFDDRHIRMVTGEK